MYATLGNIRFEGLLAPEVMERTRETSFAEHALIENKPRLQRTGEKLESLRLSIRLSSNFCVPKDEVEKIDSARRVGQIMPLIMGDGTFIGQFVVRSMKINPTIAWGVGAYESTEVEVELLEFFDPDRVQTVVANAVASGFANSQNVPIEALPIETIQSPSASALADINFVAVNQTAVLANISSSVTNPSLQPRNLADSLARLDGMATSVQNAITTINNSGQEIFNITRSLETSLIATASDIQALEALVQVNDWTSAQGAGNALSSAIDSVRGSASALTAYNAAR